MSLMEPKSSWPENWYSTFSCEGADYAAPKYAFWDIGCFKFVVFKKQKTRKETLTSPLSA